MEITADGPLGTSSVKIDDRPNIYPNPVKDLLYVNSDKEYTSYSIYNMAGQMVASEKMSGKSGMNVSRITVGQYLLKLTDKNGNTDTSQFIKK